MATTYYYPHVSGLTIYFQKLAEDLVKKGHDVTVLAAQHQKTLPKREQLAGVKVIRTPYLFKINKGLFLPLIVFHAFKSIRNTEIVHLNLPSVEAMPLALLATLMGKKIVTTYVCDIILPKFPGSKLLNWLVDLNHKVILKLSTKVVSFTKDFASNSPLLKECKDCEEVYPPIVITEDVAEVMKVRELREKNALIISMVTRIATEKGIDLMIEALDIINKKYPQAVLVIAGDTQALGEEKYQQQIDLLIKQRPNKVFLLGKLNAAELNYLYKNVDLVVIASTNSTEAFGLVQLEAMRWGTPVVATNLPGVRIPVQVTGGGEIAAIGSVADLAQRIIKVYKNRSTYSRNALKVTSIFNNSQSVEKYINIYQKTLDA